jgi:signal transduction histidine kinase
VTVTARRLAFDTALALALLTGTEFAARGALVAVIVLPLAARHAAPVAAWAVSAAATAVAVASAEFPGPGVLAPLIGLYTVAAGSARRTSAAAGLLSLTGCALLAASGSRSSIAFAGSRFRGNGALVLAGLVAVCWLIGDNVRIRRAYVAELQAKARRAAADQRENLARAAAQERARIARELHDVVVHHVSSIAVQAGAARLLAATGDSAGPGDEVPTWSGIEAAARQALAELRQLLGVLRSGHDPPARAPQPGLHDLGRLLDESRRAGLPVRATVDDPGEPLPASVSLAGYRIIQEALTNVRKHQGCAATAVVVRREAAGLRIEVSSGPSGGAALPPVPREAPGVGLAGMRERAALLGGELDARPRPDGGFLVTARIPLAGAPP